MWLSCCVLQLMVTVPPGQYLLPLETFWVVMCSLVLLASSESRPWMLLNIPVFIVARPLQQRIIEPQMSIVLRLRNPALHCFICFMSSTLKV